VSLETLGQQRHVVVTLAAVPAGHGRRGKQSARADGSTLPASASTLASRFPTRLRWVMSRTAATRASLPRKLIACPHSTVVGLPVRAVTDHLVALFRARSHLLDHQLAVLGQHEVTGERPMNCSRG